MSGERRRHPRESTLISCHVRAGKQIYEGTVMNLCEDGAFVATPAPLADETAIQLRFRHPRSHETVKARAVVAWRVRPGEGSLGIGVRLVDSLTALEPHSGAVASASGTWARPDLTGVSGIWSTVPHPRDHHTPNIHSGEFAPVGDGDLSERRGLSTPDTGRAQAGRRRVSITQPGDHPVMALLQNVSEAGFSAACERPPPEGKLFRLEIPDEGEAITLTGRVVWRTNTSGGLRSFGAEIVQYGGSASRARYEALVNRLRRT